jgi:hypothetical protein
VLKFGFEPLLGRTGCRGIEGDENGWMEELVVESFSLISPRFCLFLRLKRRKRSKPIREATIHAASVIPAAAPADNPELLLQSSLVRRLTKVRIVGNVRV